jgi:predicted metal-dependent phosphoesterase TrpH
MTENNKEELKSSYSIDCHTHPLSHAYYPETAFRMPLDYVDKALIEQMVKMSIERGLDAVAITDHNMCTSGMYAKRYAKENGLPIVVLPGCECSVFIHGQEVHVLAIDIKEPFEFDERDSLEKVVDIIHSVDGLAILAHPFYYPHMYQRAKGVVDGMEYYNGVNACNTRGNEIFDVLDKDNYKGIRTRGSDFHLTNKIHPKQLLGYTVVDEDNSYELWNRIRIAAE